MNELQHRLAAETDLDLLAEWNHQLIEDEGSRDPMSLVELRQRMAGWLATAEYRAAIFSAGPKPVAYALYAERDNEIHLRQFFVAREHRRHGHGRQAMEILKNDVWPTGKSFTVDVLTHNTDAYSFWRECGYEADYIHMRQVGRA